MKITNIFLIRFMLISIGVIFAYLTACEIIDGRSRYQINEGQKDDIQYGDITDDFPNGSSIDFKENISFGKSTVVVSYFVWMDNEIISSGTSDELPPDRVKPCERDLRKWAIQKVIELKKLR